MDGDQCTAALAGMADASLDEALNALCRARDHATQLKMSARPPKCAAFGAMARDLDYSLRTICRYMPGSFVNDNERANEAMAAALGKFITSGRQEQSAKQLVLLAPTLRSARSLSRQMRACSCRVLTCSAVR